MISRACGNPVERGKLLLNHAIGHKPNQNQIKNKKVTDVCIILDLNTDVCIIEAAAIFLG